MAHSLMSHTQKAKALLETVPCTHISVFKMAGTRCNPEAQVRGAVHTAALAAALEGGAASASAANLSVAVSSA